MAPGKHSDSIKEAIGAFDLALSQGKAVGKITERAVRATFSAIERITPNLSVDNVPNPFPAPHNLSWYFSCCACPDDVRVFATMLSKGNIRVWSVAQDREGWKILAQVFGAESSAEALRFVEQDSSVPSLRLKHHVFAGSSRFNMTAQSVDAFMHEHARALLEKNGKGHFVEVSLDRRYT